MLFCTSQLPKKKPKLFNRTQTVASERSWTLLKMLLHIPEYSVINTLLKIAKHAFQFEYIKQIHFYYTEKITSIFLFSCFVEAEVLS